MQAGPDSQTVVVVVAALVVGGVVVAVVVLELTAAIEGADAVAGIESKVTSGGDGSTGVSPSTPPIVLEVVDVLDVDVLDVDVLDVDVLDVDVPKVVDVLEVVA
jgi:hypothetical protein